MKLGPHLIDICMAGKRLLAELAIDPGAAAETMRAADGLRRLIARLEAEIESQPSSFSHPPSHMEDVRNVTDEGGAA